MGSYKKIVVGTDGSDTSLRAVDRAGALAGAFPSNISFA